MRRMEEARPNGVALAAREIRVVLDGRSILGPVTLDVLRGEVLALIGPNGSGKSTLLRALSRLVRPSAGAVLLDGEAISGLKPRALARRVAVLPQANAAPEGLRVADLVAHGRHPHRGLLAAFDRTHREVIDWAIEVTGLAPFRERALDTLSGGERQRAWIAMALAQKTDILLLDEPTTYLDISHQIELMRLIRSLNRELGVTVVWVLHDLNQAVAFSDRLAMLKDGAIHAAGRPAEIFTATNLRAVFGVDVIVTRHPETGAPVCLPTFEAQA